MAGETPKGQKRPRPSRTTISCDRCKHRKTKCIRPEHGGPCNYCRSVDQTCSTDMTKRRQKPFYFVSEEEYRLLHQLCRQSFPNEDLSVENLRNLVAQESKSVSVTGPLGLKDDIPVVNDLEPSETGGNAPAGSEDVPLPEIVGLHEDLGCLVADAQGVYRYMGAESGAGFNIAVRDWVLKAKPRSGNKEMIPAWVRAMLPGAKLKPMPESFPLDPSILPPQDVLLVCAASYFTEVHSTYWLYSSEDFYSRLEATYSNPLLQHTDSWLCSLHSIVAITAACIPVSGGKPDERLACRSLEKAKLLTSKVCDEADLDSIRALILLALALRANGYMNASYLHIGTASRIAFSLGLHLDKYHSGVVAKEHARRLWWSLFLFDQEVSLQSGRPSLSTPSSESPWQPPLPSEQIVNPGLHTPHDHLKCCVSLAHIVQKIRHNLYTGPILEGCKLSQSNFEEAMQSLKIWRADVPQHLDPASLTSVAPCYRRSISLLHLRYWSAVMFVTRPFLLCSLLRRNELRGTPKQQYFEGLAKACVSATESAVCILEAMVRQGTTSSSVLSDFFFGLQVMQLGIIASGLFGGEAHNNYPQRCLNVLKKISECGYPKQLLPEVLYQLQKLGLKDEAVLDPAVSDPSRNEIPAGSTSYVEGHSSNSVTSNTLDIPYDAMDGLDFFDMDVDDDFMEQLMQISGTYSPSQNVPELFPGTFVEHKQ